VKNSYANATQWYYASYSRMGVVVLCSVRFKLILVYLCFLLWIKCLSECSDVSQPSTLLQSSSSLTTPGLVQFSIYVLTHEREWISRRCRRGSTRGYLLNSRLQNFSKILRIGLEDCGMWIDFFFATPPRESQLLDTWRMIQFGKNFSICS